MMAEDTGPDKPIAVKNLCRVIFELASDEALLAGVVFSYHIYLPEASAAVLGAVERAISKTRSASKEKKPRLADELCTFVCKWVQYRLKTDFRQALGGSFESSSSKKKKDRKSQQPTTLMDALLALLQSEMQSDEALVMCAYRIKLAMLKTAQTRSSRRKQVRNRLNSMAAANRPSPPTTGTDEDASGDATEQKTPPEPSEPAELELDVAESSSTSSSAPMLIPSRLVEPDLGGNGESPASGTSSTASSIHGGDSDGAVLPPPGGASVGSNGLMRLDPSGEEDSSFDDDASLDSDIRRARGIVPSLSFLTFDELEDAAISGESDSSPGLSNGLGRLANSEPIMASDALSASSPGVKRLPGYLDPNDARFLLERTATPIGSPFGASGHRLRAPSSMRRQFLQQMLLGKAKQLTLLEAELFQIIPPMEFFKLGWQKEQKRVLAPRIVNNLTHFNQLSFWVSRTVCEGATLDERVGILKQHLTLAELCLRLCNYNSLMAILGGLNNAAVQRLKQTWGALQLPYQKLWTRMNSLMESRSNYAKYRATVDEALNTNTPIIPFLGVILRDFAFIDEGNDDYSDPKQKYINVAKMRLIGNQLLLVERLQRLTAEYSIVVDRPTRKFWRASIVPLPDDSDDLLYARSCEVEPKQP